MVRYRPGERALHNTTISIKNSRGRETKLAIYTADVVLIAHSIEDTFREIHDYVDPFMDELIISEESAEANEVLGGREMQVNS